MYYTYAHSKPEDKIFYIGKGTGRRAWDKQNRNPYWHNVVNKYGYNVQVLAEWKTEQEALEHEVFLIACFKDMGYELVNMTDGGESNPMSNLESVIKMAKTKREKGQYSGKEMAIYNASYEERMKDPIFAKKISEKRKQANTAMLQKQNERKKEIVLQIRKLRSEGKKLKELKEIFNLSEGRISDICNRKTYANIS